MKLTAYIFLLVLALLLVPAVHAEDAQDWNTRGQYANTIGDYTNAITYFDRALRT